MRAVFQGRRLGHGLPQHRWCYEAVALITSAFVVAVSAQQGAQSPVFRAGVDLLTLDVTVVDRDGRPVTELAAKDFVVKIDGHARPVRTLEYQRFGGPLRSDVLLPPGTTQLGPTVGPVNRGGRAILLLFDDLSAKAGEAKGLLVAVERALAGLGPDDLIGLATTSGLGPVVSPTRDRALVMATLRSRLLVGRDDDAGAPFFITATEALDILDSRRGVLQGVISRECSTGTQCADQVRAAARRVAVFTVRRAEMQIAAFKGAIDALRGAPRPRIIITVSKGLAFRVGHIQREELDKISQAAAHAAVQFYGLTEISDGIDIKAVGQPSLPPYDRVTAQRIENDFLTDGLQTVASAAGGQAFKVIGQADRFFDRILAETSGLYALGVEIPSLKPGQRLVDVKVAVGRPGVTVRARHHASPATVAATPIPIDDALQMRLSQGGHAFGVPISLATAIHRDSRGDLELVVEGHVPAAVPAPLVAMFAVLDTPGQVVQSGRREIAQSRSGGDYRIAFAVPLAAGSYRLRFAVADANGSIGSVQQPVSAVLPRVGSTLTSDLLMGWAAGDEPLRLLILDILPALATTVRATIELYPHDVERSSSLKVRFTLLGSDGAVPLTVTEATPVRNGTALLATATLPVAGLASGTYSIHAAVLDAGSVLGTLSRSFQKASSRSLN